MLDDRRHGLPSEGIGSSMQIFGYIIDLIALLQTLRSVLVKNQIQLRMSQEP